MEQAEPIRFEALLCAVKFLQTGDGEATLVLKVPKIHASKAAALAMFVPATAAFEVVIKDVL